MKKYIETIGNIIEKETLTHPERARKLLIGAYTYVRVKGKLGKKRSLHAAYDYMNSAIAGTIVDSFRHPEQSVMVNIFMPCELLHAMGLQPMFPEGISAYLACTGCQNVFAETAECADVPETFCSYHKTMIGTGESGVMPKPLLIANTTLACDANQLSFRRLSELYQCPHTVIDIPHSTELDAIQYVADQLRALARQLEELSGRRLDEQVLRETMDCSRRTVAAYRDFLERRGEVSLPTTMTGEMCSMIADHVMLGRRESEEYMNRILRCAENAPRRSGRKARVFWMHTLPNWQDSMQAILETDGRCELVGADIGVDTLTEIDPDKPYESMARRAVESIINGSAQRRLDAVIHWAKTAQADGVILFCHWGCKQTLGLSQLAKQALEAEGLPTLVLDGDGCDSRNVADGQMVTRVNAFLEQLEGGMRA